jgi:phage terminase small subunit
MPKPPESLGKKGKVHWEFIVKPLVQARVISKMDLPLLEMACKAFESWEEAEDEDARRKSSAEYLRIMKEYGATPRSRQALASREKPGKGNEKIIKKKSKNEKEEEDLFEAFE